VRALCELYKNEPRVSIESYNGLTVDFAKELGARYIIRSFRTHKDYEYELQMADVNKQLAPEVETIVLFSDSSLTNISSSIVRELAKYGRDITPWLPNGLDYHINNS
jgi:pantetheine-phosphate adenylyltransferase